MVEVDLSSPLLFTQDYEEEETEAFDVSLTKNTQGLGITIAGYVGDKNSGEKHYCVHLVLHMFPIVFVALTQL